MTILLKEIYRSRFTVVPLNELFLFKCMWHLTHHRCDPVRFQSSSKLIFFLTFPGLHLEWLSNKERLSPLYPGGLAGILYSTQIWISPQGFDFLRLFEFPQITVQKVMRKEDILHSTNQIFCSIWWEISSTKAGNGVGFHLVYENNLQHTPLFLFWLVLKRIWMVTS